MRERWRFLGALVLFSWACVLMVAATSWATGSRAEWRAKVDPSVLAGVEAGPTEFFVYLERKADLSPAAKLRTKRAKGRFVYNRLRTVAAASQAPVVAELRRRGVEHRALWITNAVWARAGREALRAVAELPGVAHVYSAGGRVGLDPPVRESRPRNGADAQQAVASGIAHVKANQVWPLGITGQGATVASGDTGVRWTHNALKSKYRGWNGSTADHNYNWWDAVIDPVICPSPSQQPCDDHDHGSHTTGTMVGDDGVGQQIGMAPGAKWIACRNMAQGFGEGPLDYAECMEFFIAPTKLDGTAPNPDLSPDVVNNSWGCVEACASPLLLDELNASRAAGIVYVASAGNDGFGAGPPEARGCSTIIHPLARYIPAFTVGSTVVGAADAVSSFSSRGPVPPGPDTLGHRKPDIAAPGSNIFSSTSGNDNTYAVFSGTSMSGPHVAGLVALIIDAKESLRGQVDAIENIIEQSAVHKTTTDACGDDTTATMPNNSYGWGRIDALAAVQMALGPTAVKLMSFTASRTRAGVNLRWRTGTGIGALGFNVWRSAKANGSYEKVNRSLLLAKTQTAPASYSFVDRRASGFYKLELKNAAGPSVWAGPVRAS